MLEVTEVDNRKIFSSLPSQLNHPCNRWSTAYGSRIPSKDAPVACTKLLTRLSEDELSSSTSSTLAVSSDILVMRRVQQHGGQLTKLRLHPEH